MRQCNQHVLSGDMTMNHFTRHLLHTGSTTLTGRIKA